MPPKPQRRKMLPRNLGQIHTIGLRMQPDQFRKFRITPGGELVRERRAINPNLQIRPGKNLSGRAEDIFANAGEMGDGTYRARKTRRYKKNLKKRG